MHTNTQTDRLCYLCLLQAGHPGGQFEGVLLGARPLAPQEHEGDEEDEDEDDAGDHAGNDD